MANAIMTAKNTFGDGLLMDLAPDNTQATCLSNALNATLVTMNGNELSLQNDMGNGRVETAYLPEGYIPVGTCEFGDIIYIVSYNPLTNKSQIGCFPSPERNISSDELGCDPQSLTDADFLDGENVINNSVKKILCHKDLKPGDKFIVYSTTALDTNAEIITDYGNTSEILYSFPKYLKIHLVAIEDSGKINYLDSNLKWYGTDKSHYYISSGNQGINNKDVDNYRNLLSSGYSVFQSKVSGKLAILAELERIDGFSCTYDIYKTSSNEDITSEGIYKNTYKIFLNCNWHTNNNDVNPYSLKISDINWASNRDKKYAGTYQKLSTTQEGEEGKGEISEPIYLNKDIQEIKITYPDSYHSNMIDYGKFINCNFSSFVKKKSIKKVSYAREKGIPKEGYYYLDLTTIYKGNYYDSNNSLIEGAEKISDIIINNFYKSSFYKEFITVDIPNIQALKVDGQLVQYPIDKQDLILKYVVTPKMEYGLLPDLAITSYIDFSKVGTGTINLNSYKYYIGENLCTLNLETEIYSEENKGVQEILLEFYDNQGLCATYHINDRASYSGNIVEYIPLNGESTNYKLSNLDDNKQLIYHAGLEDTNGTVIIDSTSGKASKKPDKYSGTVYLNDAGTLYSNMLYAVQIVIKYKSKDILGQYDSADTNQYKRYWRWLWTNTIFNDYYFTVKDFDENEIKLDLDLSVDYKPEYENESFNAGYQENLDQANLYKGLGSKIQHLNGNIKYKINLGLQNTYNTFTLEGSSTTGAVKDTNISVSIGENYFNIDNQIIYTNNKLTSDNNLLSVNLDNNYKDLINNYQYIANGKTYINIYDTDGINKYNPIGLVTINGGTNQTINYLSSKSGQIITKECSTKSQSLQYFYGDFKQNLVLDLWNPSNYLYLFTSEQKNLPVINNLLPQYESYGLTYDNGYFYFKNTLCLWANDGYHGEDKQRYIIKLNLSKSLQETYNALGDLDYFNKDGDFKDGEAKSLRDNEIGYYIKQTGGSGSHSQFKNGNSYFFRDEGTTHEWLFPRNSFTDGFFTNFIMSPIQKGNYKLEGVNSMPPGAFQLAFKDDSGLHLFNHFEGEGISSFTIGKVSRVLATLVASWMAQTFEASSSTQLTSVNTLYDLLYNKGQVQFIQDIVYKATLDEINEVTLQGIKYTNYINQLIENSSITNFKKNNIDIKFNSVQKTIPIQINLDYILPDMPKTPTFKINAYESTADWDCSQVIPGQLYQLSPEHKLIPLGNNQIIKRINETIIENNQFVFKFGGQQQMTMANVFNYIDNHLVAKRTAPQTGSYSIKVDNGGYGQGYITDLLKADTVVPKTIGIFGEAKYQVQ